MICPHCSTVVKFDWRTTLPLENNEKIGFLLLYAECPNCDKLVVNLQRGTTGYETNRGAYMLNLEWEKTIYPQQNSFQNEKEIPPQYLEDYEESIKVISASPKASAALSRRLLQNIIREEFKIKDKSLIKEIENFSQLPGIPSHITDAVDAVRNIGNLAAHPTKDLNTGEIVPVEIGEAEWLIEVIEALFDFTFIQPKKLEKRKNELNLKLEKVGKPKMQ